MRRHGFARRSRGGWGFRRSIRSATAPDDWWMPWWRYIANRCLTFYGNVLMGSKLSEFHTGYRAFSKELLEKVNLEPNSDDFVFDNQMLAQIAYGGFIIGEVTCPTKYFDDASSINFRRSAKYGMGVLGTSLLYRLNKWGLAKSRIFNLEKGERLRIKELEN